MSSFPRLPSLPAPPFGIAAVLGAGGVCESPWLPPREAGLAAFAFAVIALVCAGRRQRSRLAPATASGGRVAAWLVWVAVLAGCAGAAVLQAHRAIAARWPVELEGQALRLAFVVDRLPLRTEHGWRLGAEVIGCETPPSGGCPVGRRIRLGWSTDPGPLATATPTAFAPGERWRAVLGCRRAVAPFNPGLFDAELKAAEDAVDAFCQVRGGKGRAPPERLTGDAWSPLIALESLRAAVADAVRRAMSDAAPGVTGVVLGLTIGDQAAIPADWWDRFNRTGTGHLFSISGSHVTLLGALAGWVAGAVWRRLPERRGARGPRLARLPVPVVRGVAAVVAATGYALIAGWGVPAQRTCLMLACAVAAVLAGRGRGMAGVLSVAATAVLVLDPLAVESAGFWLSFVAVAAIVWAGAGRRPPDRRPRWAGLRAAVGTQWAVTVGLFPLSALMFASTSAVGPLANAFAIPAVTVIAAPLSLLGALLALLHPQAGALPLQAAGWSIDLLVRMLGWLDDPRAALLVVGRPTPGTLALAITGAVLMLSPIPFRGRRLAGLAMLPLLVAPVDPQAAERLRVHAIDVGQGMAVLVEHDGRRLLYDTGPAVRDGPDAGARIIVPWLRTLGVSRLDALVLSHEDADHTGGARSVLAGVRVERLIASFEPEPALRAMAAAHARCVRGEGWRWGEVVFEWLHPGPGGDAPSRGRSPTNAHSCVLRIGFGRHRVLLPGDLEAPQERMLLRESGAAALRADVILAPHHGSLTSSSPAFVAAVGARWVLCQVGYRNRFGHPAPAVEARWRETGARILRTDRDGATTLLFGLETGPEITRARWADRRWWRMPVGTPSAHDEDG